MRERREPAAWQNPSIEVVPDAPSMTILRHTGADAMLAVDESVRSVRVNRPRLGSRAFDDCGDADAGFVR